MASSKDEEYTTINGDDETINHLQNVMTIPELDDIDDEKNTDPLQLDPDSEIVNEMAVSEMLNHNQSPVSNATASLVVVANVDKLLPNISMGKVNEKGGR